MQHTQKILMQGMKYHSLATKSYFFFGSHKSCIPLMQSDITPTVGIEMPPYQYDFCSGD